MAHRALAPGKYDGNAQARAVEVLHQMEVGGLLMPSQYRDLRRHLEIGGEKRLLLEVLAVAVLDFLRQHSVLCNGDAKRRERRRKALSEDARAWFEERNTRCLCSFESICSLFDLDPDYFWQGLKKVGSGPIGDELSRLLEE